MKTFAISDVHGCYDELMALYKQLPIDPKKDKLIFLGDYVDRGPDVKSVVEQMIKWEKLYPHWVFLYGNHEDLLLDALDSKHPVYGDYYVWWLQGGRETTFSYLPPEVISDYDKALAHPEDLIPKEHIEWLQKRPRFFETEDYIFVHGGLKPSKTAQETSPYDLIWIRDEFIDSSYDWGKKVIFGHTPEKNPQVKENKIGIDTGCCYGNKLTAIELPIEKFYYENKRP